MPANVSIPASSAAIARIEGGTGEEAANAFGGLKIVDKCEWLSMAHPALEWVRKLVLQTLGHIDECRSSRAAVQIFVSAADGEVATAVLEVELDRPGAVRKIPNAQRSGGVRGIADGAHVVDGGRTVIDVGEGNDSSGTVDRIQDLARTDGAQFQIQHLAKTLRDVEVGWEICLLSEDYLAPRFCSSGRGKQLEQADAG